MTNEIKQRIEQINNGIVPEGYRKTKAGIMPLDWLADGEVKAKQVFTSVSYKNNSFDLEVLSATQEQGVIPRSMVNIDIKFDEGNTSGYKRVDKGDFVISLRSFQGGIEYSEYNGVVSPAYTVLKPIIDISDGFYRYYFKSADYITRLNQGTYGIRDGKQIGYKDFGEMIIHYPPIEEQEKIAEILATQDKIIELKQKLIDKKVDERKYLLQILISENYIEEKLLLSSKITKLENYIIEQSERNKNNGTTNVLSVSNKLGFVSQLDQFGKQIASGDVSNYKVVKNGYIAYNPSRINVGSIALYDKDIDGIISPMYVVLKTKKDLLPDYLILLTETHEFYQKMKSLLSGGVRDSLSFSDLCKLKFVIPNIESQTKIVNIMKQQSIELDLLKQDLEQEKLKKKALMQLLLTGIVRV